MKYCLFLIVMINLCCTDQRLRKKLNNTTWKVVKVELIDDSVCRHYIDFSYIQFYMDSIAIIDGDFDNYFTYIYNMQTEYSDTSFKMNYIDFENRVIYANHKNDVKLNYKSNKELDLIFSYSNFKIIYYLNFISTNEFNKNRKKCNGNIKRYDKPIYGNINIE
ncbi:MAG: hypothetical protein IT265_16430 [Saprospiraceae bacterium]|nr:hypothetical protein [Saprospiraceae bacterium]